MLELNKEYTYREICEELNWKINTGCSKKAQIKEIESAFKFYHPENKKTHKPKKSYIFTEIFREPVQPSVKNNGGSNNNKNITPTMDYIRGVITRDMSLEEPFTMSKLFCEILELMNIECYSIPYKDDPEIDAYCQEKHLHSIGLFKDYSSTLKKVLKEIVLKSIEVLGKKNLAEYEDGYKIYYQMVKNAKTDEGEGIRGEIFTTDVNAEILENETLRCNELNDKYFLSDNMTGRQLLRKIFASKALTKEFGNEKIKGLMKNEDVIKKLNDIIDETYNNPGFNCSPKYISEDRPIIDYYRAVCINYIENLHLSESELIALAKEICHIVINKSRKSFFQNKYNRKYYDSVEDKQDMVTIEKLLFRDGLLDDLVEDMGHFADTG